jgi:branched-chain amino acid transport system ATP-binding protein
MVEHDVELVLELSEDVTVLDFGRVIARGSPADIRSSANVQAAYLGAPADAESG